MRVHVWVGGGGGRVCVWVGGEGGDCTREMYCSFLAVLVGDRVERNGWYVEMLTHCFQIELLTVQRLHSNWFRSLLPSHDYQHKLTLNHLL